MAWVDGISVSGVVQVVSAVAAAISAIAACAAARATYRSIEQPALERKKDARAEAISALDGFVVDLAAMRRTFDVRSTVVERIHGAYKEGKREDLVAAINGMAEVDGTERIPKIAAGFHNLELLLALDRLRASVLAWSSKTKKFTFDLHSHFQKKEDLEVRELDAVKELNDRVLSDMRKLGKLMIELFPERKEELSCVVSESRGIVLEKSPV